MATRQIVRTYKTKLANEQAQIDEHFKATLHHPHMTDRRRELLAAWGETNNYYAVAELLFLLAKRDLAEVEGIRKMYTRITSASMQLLINDYEANGPKHILHILMSVKAEIITAIIKNNLGYEYMNTPGFSEHFPPTDDLAGIYSNTLVKVLPPESKGCFLSPNEIRSLQALMRQYIRGLPNDEQAIAIDKVYKPSDWSLEQTRSGERRWISKAHSSNPNGQTATFCDKLSDRINAELDPTGAIELHQAPLEIGYASVLQTRMRAHLPGKDMSKSTSIWVLVLSCLKVLKLEMRVISVPITNISHPEHGALAETVFTMLGGSMAEDGGFNPIQPGQSNKATKVVYAQENVRLWDGGKTILRDSMENVTKELDRRKKMVADLTTLRTGDFSPLLLDNSELGKECDDIERRQIGLEDRRSTIEKNHTLAYEQSQAQVEFMDAFEDLYS